MKTKLIIGCLAVSLLSACASTPKQEEVMIPQEPAPVPQPVFERPAPVPAPVPVIVAEPAPVFTGPTPGSLEDFAVNAGNRVYFGYDQFDLTAESASVLQNQAQWLNTYNGTIVVIEGNADERGTREYNLALGARRADRVKAYLVSQGVDPKRITTVSYGKERPIDGRSNEDAWSRNRNAHTNVLSGANS